MKIMAGSGDDADAGLAGSLADLFGRRLWYAIGVAALLCECVPAEVTLRDRVRHLFRSTCLIAASRLISFTSASTDPLSPAGGE